MKLRIVNQDGGIATRFDILETTSVACAEPGKISPRITGQTRQFVSQQFDSIGWSAVGRVCHVDGQLNASLETGVVGKDLDGRLGAKRHPDGSENDLIAGLVLYQGEGGERVSLDLEVFPNGGGAGGFSSRFGCRRVQELRIVGGQNVLSCH